MEPFDVLGQTLGGDRFFVIGGPCVIESEEMVLQIAAFLRDTCRKLEISCVFKSSYDKANRTSLHSFRGPGLEAGLQILNRVRQDTGIPVLTDIHSAPEAARAALFTDILQIPAFLARQTDLLQAAGMTGKPVNLKKAQFLAPWDMRHSVEKVRATGNDRILLTERGTVFGYNNLVVDMRSIAMMKELGHPVVFDATHSVQLPGGRGDSSGGQRQYVAPLACAAVAAGANGVFLEMHPDPGKALCDGPNSLPLEEVPPLLEKLVRIHQMIRT